MVSVATGSATAFAHYGLSFVWSGTWSPTTGQYATGVLVVGTALTTGAAMLLSAPIGLGAAVALSEFVPRKVAAAASTFIELLAAVPSIVVGLWALLVLSPLFATDVEPFLRSLPVLGVAFSGPAYGPSILLAAVVLAVMTLPTVVALCAHGSPGSAGRGPGSGHGAGGHPLASGPQGCAPHGPPWDRSGSDARVWAALWAKRSQWPWSSGTGPHCPIR